MGLKRRWVIAAGVVTLSIGVIAAGCGGQKAADSGADKKAEGGASTETAGKELTGTILADGSSTVFPIMEAMAEEFRGEAQKVNVTVGVSGTGGGFEKFCNDETDFQNASRPIKDEELAKCKEKGVEFVEMQVGYDGLSVMVNPANDFVKCLTVEELNKIWMPESKVKTWKDVKAEWPADPIKLYGAGTDSGTFDYFTDKINGDEGVSRSDYTASEDDNVLVQGIAGDKGALGYFGYAYYEENKDKLGLVAVDGGSGCIAPSPATILDKSYTPLSRPIFIYVKKGALERPEVAEFAKFVIGNAKDLVPSVGYVADEDKIYAEEMAELEAAL